MRKIIVAALGAFGGTLGYGYILNAPKNTILPASFIGLAGYIVYILLGMAGFGTMSAYFFSTGCKPSLPPITSSQRERIKSDFKASGLSSSE